MTLYPSPNISPVPYNSTYTCMEDLERDSCFLTSAQRGEYDALAIFRVVISCLSIVGAVSIVISVTAKKQVRSPKVHPIFVLSLADAILGTLFLIGGSLWLGRPPSRVGCFAVSLPTVILECVTMNLTVVYGLLAYSAIKKKNISNLTDDKDRVWSRLKNSILYLIAWITPIVMVMIGFGIVDRQANLVTKTNQCSCYCLPVIGNILPFVLPRDEGSALYNQAARRLLLAYAIVQLVHYLVCFTLLLIIYCKLLKYIRSLRKDNETVHTDSHKYGATGTLLIQGESKARKRVVYFMTVFVVNGFFNSLLSLFWVGVHAGVLGTEAYVREDPYFRIREQTSIERLTVILLFMESLTAPLQGFLNALVYGWTREKFVTIAGYKKNEDQSYQDMGNVLNKDPASMDLEGSAEFEGTAFTEEQVSMVNKMTRNIQNKGSRRGRRVGSEDGQEEQIMASVESDLSDSEYEDR